MSWRVEPNVEPNVEPSDSVREALMQVAGRAVRRHTKLVALCGLGAVVMLAASLWDVGARAPVDLPILCGAIAFAIGGVMAFVAKRRTAAFLARATAQDLIGFTPNDDKSLWLHFRNGRTLRTPKLSFDLALIEAALPVRPAPPKLQPGALIAWAVVLAPVGAGLWLNTVPIPVQISQIKSTRGHLQFTGNAVLMLNVNLKMENSPVYASLLISDGSGRCRVLVEADAIPATERIRHEPGIPVRVVVQSKHVRYEGAIMKDMDVLFADSFEILDSGTER